MALPAAIPVTRPDDEPTVAVPVALLVHTPMPVASESVVVRPWQTDAVPVIATGRALTVVCSLYWELHPKELVTVRVGV